MNNSEILTALKLPSGKHGNFYAAKMANIFKFLSSIKAAILSVTVIERCIYIDYDGKRQSYSQIAMDYKQRLLSKIDASHFEAKKDAIQSNIQGIRYERNKKGNLKLKKELTEAEQKEIDECHLQLQETDSQIEMFISLVNEKVKQLTPTIKEMLKELNLLKCVKFEITTANGKYRFTIPLENKFYNAVCKLIGFEFTDQDAKELKATYTISSEIISAIKKARVFLSDDDLRPAMTCVCLHFENKTCQVVATDAHRIYLSKLFECNVEGEFNLLMPLKAAVKVSAIKTKESSIEIKNFSDGSAQFDTISFEWMDARFPDYKAVIPEYKTGITFNREDFITSVKTVLPYANKSTAQVALHLNGEILMTAQEVDFGFESVSRLMYVEKTMPDTDIAFNGKFLIECLSVFKDESVEMLSAGKNTQGALFTNNVESFLLMPLMLNNY